MDDDGGGARGAGDMTTTLPRRVDLSSPRLHAEEDLTDYFAALRAEAACVRHETPDGRPYHVVCRHADVAALLRKSSALASSGGNVMDTILDGGDPGAHRMLALMDGPRHLELRRLLHAFFTKEPLAALEPRLRSLATELVAQHLDGEPLDFAEDVAAPLPIMAVCELLGVPPEDHRMLVTWASSALGADDANYSAADARLVKSELLLYFYKLAQYKKKSPSHDLISTLVEANVCGAELSVEDVILNCYSLLLGGDETTRLAMIGAVEVFAREHATWQALRTVADLGPAVEEVLRWTTPALHVARTVTRSLPIGDMTLGPGDVVVLWAASANNDEGVFRAPRQFDPVRAPNPHVTFASGTHFCLGAQLARLELSCLLDVMRTRVRGFELTAAPRRLYSNFLSGFAALPVAMRSA